MAPCLFAIFVDILGYGLAVPLLISFFSSPDNNIFHLSSPILLAVYLGVSLALYNLLMFFGSSFIGDLSDRIGRKKTLLISMVGMTIGFLMMGFGVIWTSLTLFLLGRALGGLVAASQSVALATVSDLSTKENKAIHLSYIAFIQCIGLIIGPLLSGILSISANYTPFLFASLLAVIAYLWIYFSFEETFIINHAKKVTPLRIIEIFIEAYKNKQIRVLCFAFLTMQMGIALYIPVILILISTEFNYSTLLLGIFNGYLGAGFALGLLLFLPKLIKYYKIEQIVFHCLVISCITQFFSAITHSEILQWAFALPFSAAVEIAFSGMFTSFSNAADSKSQGWAMGISVSIMALAWAISGFATQLTYLIGVHMIILIGALLLAISALTMKLYNYYFIH